MDNYQYPEINQELNDYLLKEELSRGSFAKVYKCRNTKTSKDYAIKVMNLTYLESLSK